MANDFTANQQALTPPAIVENGLDPEVLTLLSEIVDSYKVEDIIDCIQLVTEGLYEFVAEKVYDAVHNRVDNIDGNEHLNLIDNSVEKVYKLLIIKLIGEPTIDKIVNQVVSNKLGDIE